MKNYKSNDNKIKLINGDSFLIIDRMIEKNIKINCVITDPPYEISNSGGGMLDRDNRKFIKQIDEMGMCKSNFDINLFLTKLCNLFPNRNKFCGIFYCSRKQLIKYLQFAEENNLQYGIGVWHKTNPAPLCNYKYLNDIEYWVYIKGKESKILGEYKTKSMVYTSTINKKDKELYGHPTIKPVEMINNFVINHTLEDDIVFDPFMGTGTTGVSCKKLNRQFIGIELDEKWFNQSIDRLK